MLIECCRTWIATSLPSLFTVSMVQHIRPPLRPLRIGTIAAPMAFSCRCPMPPSLAVATRPALEIVGAERTVDHVYVAPAYVAQVVAMRLLLDVADAVLRHERAIAQAETVERGAADTARGVAAGHDHGVDPLLGEVVGDAGLEEDRRALLGHLQVVIRFVDARIEPGAGMAMQEGLAHRGDLPVRHLALVEVGGVAYRHRHAVPARHR